MKENERLRLMINDNRDEAIDALKGVAILLVVLGHIKVCQSIGDFIYTFHMPLFMFLSGCTFWYSYGRKAYRKPLNETLTYIKQRFIALVIPNISWTIICYLVLKRDIRNDILGGIGVYWFLPTLFGFIVIMGFCEYTVSRLCKKISGGGGAT